MAILAGCACGGSARSADVVHLPERQEAVCCSMQQAQHAQRACPSQVAGISACQQPIFKSTLERCNDQDNHSKPSAEGGSLHPASRMGNSTTASPAHLPQAGQGHLSHHLGFQPVFIPDWQQDSLADLNSQKHTGRQAGDSSSDQGLHIRECNLHVHCKAHAVAVAAATAAAAVAPTCSSTCSLKFRAVANSDSSTSQGQEPLGRRSGRRPLKGSWCGERDRRAAVLGYAHSLRQRSWRLAIDLPSPGAMQLRMHQHAAMRQTQLVCHVENLQPSGRHRIVRFRQV